MDSSAASRDWLPGWKASAVAFAVGILPPTALTLASGSFCQFLLSAAVVILAGPIVLVVTPVVLALALRPNAGPAARANARGMLLVGIMVLAQVPAVALGLVVEECRVRATQEWCEGIAAQVEEWRRVHGTYPAELSDLGIQTASANPFKNSLAYYPREDGFVLDFFDGGLFSGYRYDSQTGEWRHYD